MKAKLNPLEQNVDFVSDFSKGMIVTDICRALRKTGMTRSELARRMGVDRQRVTRILNETDNFTVETLAKISCALGWKLSVRLVDPAEAVSIVPLHSAARVVDVAPAESHANGEQGMQADNGQRTVSQKSASGRKKEVTGKATSKELAKSTAPR